VTTPTLSRPPTTYQNIKSTGTGTQIIQAGSGSQVLVYNGDIFNVLYVSPYSSPAYTNSIQIQPLTNAVIDGTRTQYALSAPPTPFPTGGSTNGIVSSVTVAPGATSMTPSPAQIAAQTGIPPSDNPQVLIGGVNFNQTIAAGPGTTFTTPKIPVTQFQSWFGKMFAESQVGGPATPFVKATIQWSLTADNNDPTHVEDWVIASAPFNFFYNFQNYCQGPCYGDTLQITFTNYDTNAVNITYGLMGSYRTRIRTVIRGQYNWNAGGSQNEGAGLGTDDILLAQGLAPIAANSSGPSTLINLAEGPAIITGLIPTTVAGLGTEFIVQIMPQATYAANGGGQIIIPCDANGNLAPTGLVLPRRACILIPQNNTAHLTAATGFVTIVTQIQPE
jgi:hypothetical protein